MCQQLPYPCAAEGTKRQIKTSKLYNKTIILPRVQKLLYYQMKDRAWPFLQDCHLTRFLIDGEYLVMTNPITNKITRTQLRYSLKRVLKIVNKAAILDYFSVSVT